MYLSIIFQAAAETLVLLGQIPATIAGYLLHAMMAVRGESKILGYNAQYSLFGTYHPGTKCIRPVAP